MKFPFARGDDKPTTSSGAREGLLSRGIRFIVRFRRLTIAFLLSAAVAVTVQALTPTAAPTRNVLVATTDLRIGSELTAANTAEKPVPAGPYTNHAFTAEQLPRKAVLAAPVRAGQVLVDTMLSGQGLLTGNAPGTEAVPLRLADPGVLSLLQPGQNVKVVASGSADPTGSQTTQATVVVEKVTVIWVPPKASNGASMWSGSTSDDRQGLVLVAASPSQATALATIASQKVSVVILSG